MTTKLLAVGASAAMAVGLAPTAEAQTATLSGPTASAVGALFPNSTTGVHTCSASVVNSTSGDLIVTAAHCVHGNGRGMKFAPGYAWGSRPYGTWTTTAAYVPSSWASWRNPAADVAVLRVDRPIQRVVGGYTMSGTAPTSGLNVTVRGYAYGSGDHQRACTTKVYYNGSFPAFNCGGFPGGTSGSPWVSGGRIYGVIGGLHQGGCVSTTSYSSNLAASGGIGRYLVTRAQNHWAANTNIPYPGSDGC